MERIRRRIVRGVSGRESKEPEKVLLLHLERFWLIEKRTGSGGSAEVSEKRGIETGVSSARRVKTGPRRRENGK